MSVSANTIRVDVDVEVNDVCTVFGGDVVKRKIVSTFILGVLRKRQRRMR